MEAIFLWIYRLDIPDVLILTLLGTIGFLYLRSRWGGKRWWKQLMAVLLLLWLAAVLTQTVLDRQAGTAGASPVPFRSYVEALKNGRRELLRSNFMNALLFYPAGLMAWDLLPNSLGIRHKVLLITAGAMVLSAIVESLQYFRMLGLAETDDVIHNTLGAGLAAAVYCIRFKRSDHHDTNGTDFPAYSADRTEQ